MRATTRRAFLVAAALLPGGCAGLGSFDVPLDAEGTIPGAFSRLGGVSGFDSLGSAGGTVSRTVENQGAETKDIRTARLATGALVVTAPAGADLSCLRAFSMEVSAPGLETRRVASRADFPRGQTRYDLQLDDVELREYIGAPSMTFTPKFDLATRPAQDIQLGLDLSMHVELAL